MHKPIHSGTLSRKSVVNRVVSLSWLKNHLIIDVTTHLFIILFLYTGIAKLMDFNLFEEQLYESPVIAPIAPIVAWSMPIIEILISISLFHPRFRLLGLYASFVLMSLFTIYVIVILNIDKELPCSCGGIVEMLSWKGHLFVNSALVLLALISIRLQSKLIKEQKVPDTDPSLCEPV